MFIVLVYIHMRHAHTEKSECMYMLVHVVSCLIFPHSHTTIMLLGNIGLVLPVGIVVCRELSLLSERVAVGEQDLAIDRRCDEGARNLVSVLSLQQLINIPSGAES